MKKFISVVLGLIVIFSFVGCSIKTNTSNNTTTNNNSSQTATENKENNNFKNDDNDSNKNTKNSIVVYFSRTNNTENIANYIVEITNSNKYEIEAKIPYTDDDIKYYTNCRADKEQNDPSARPEIGSEILI